MIGLFHYTLVLIKHPCISELGLLVVRIEVKIKSKGDGNKGILKTKK